MSAQPKYITQPEFDAALTAFSGHVDHTINMSKADLRREIIDSENRLSAKLDTLDNKIDALENKMESLENRMGSLENRMDTLETRLDRVENMGKVNHQMLQLILDQLSTINKKLGTN